VHTDASVLATDNRLYPIVRHKGWTCG